MRPLKLTVLLLLAAPVAFAQGPVCSAASDAVPPVPDLGGPKVPRPGVWKADQGARDVAFMGQRRGATDDPTVLAEVDADCDGTVHVAVGGFEFELERQGRGRDYPVTFEGTAPHPYAPAVEFRMTATLEDERTMRYVWVAEGVPLTTASAQGVLRYESGHPAAGVDSRPCECAHVRRLIAQHEGDRRVFQEVLAEGKPDGTAWGALEGDEYYAAVRERIAGTRATPGGAGAAMTTSPATCAIDTRDAEWEGSGYPPVYYAASYLHERVHQRTCCEVNAAGARHYEDRRARERPAEGASTGADRQAWDQRHPYYSSYSEYMDHPQYYHDDEVAAYGETVRVLREWHGEHCPAD